MNIDSYISNMKKIQNYFLEYLENDDNIEENYQQITHLLDDLQIQNDQKMLKSVLYLLTNISTNHYRENNFYEKIEKLIKKLKIAIQNNFSNYEIFKLFKKDKNIVLYLIKEKIIIVDQLIADKMCCENFLYEKYPHFFIPEIKKFLTRDHLKQIIFNETACENSETQYEPQVKDYNIFSEILEFIDELIKAKAPEDFEKKRSIGENDNKICEIIRKDLIDEFILLVNKECISLKSKINSSIYETNPLLLKNETTLIEYAAFFGSIQIFNYLRKNQVDLTPSLWIYGIHSKNTEIIHILDENDILPDDVSFNKCLKESIKCHHIEITNYIQNNIINQNNEEESYDDESSSDEESDFDLSIIDNEIISYSFHYYNFAFFPKNVLNKKATFYLACKYDYYQIVDYFIKSKKIDVNKLIVQTLSFKYDLFFRI